VPPPIRRNQGTDEAAPEAVNDALKLSESFAETVDRRIAFSYRLSERGLCTALPQLGREDPRGRSRKSARPLWSRRSSRALSVQADGLQG
jgi:hypothetical protein